MKKVMMLVIFILMACIFGPATHASLVKTYTDNPVDFLIGNNTNPQSYSYSFINFLSDFQPGSITAATLTVYLKDDSDSTSDKFTLKADGTSIYNEGGSFEMPDVSTPYSKSVFDYVSDGSILAFIQRDGNNNDFYFEKFELKITGESPTVVPIPAAAWLLGTGLVGLVVIRRRKQ